MVLPGGMGYLGEMGSGDQLVPLAPPGPVVEGHYTQGGGRVPAHKRRVQSWSTQESLEGVGIDKEVEPTIFACQRVHHSHQNTAPASAIVVGSRVMPLYQEQSMRALCKEHMITTCLVLYATSPLDSLWS
jgi:hypothetical protein